MRPYGPSLPTRHWPLWLRYLATVGLVAFVVVLQAVWREAGQFPFLLFFSSIMLCAVLFNSGASYLATALSAGLLVFFAVEPQYAPSGVAVLDWIGWAIFVVVALFCGYLIELLHKTLSDLRRANDALAISENQKDLLLREAAHRTRNDFMQLIAILRLEEMRAKGGARAQETLRAIAHRVHVFSRLQERLSRSREEQVVVEIRDFIADLCSDLHLSLAGVRPVKVEAHADSSSVPEPAAVAIGLIVNELVTNALKHAFPDNRAGKVDVIFRAHQSGEYTLCVEDDGVGIDGAKATGEQQHGHGTKADQIAGDPVARQL